MFMTLVKPNDSLHAKCFFEFRVVTRSSNPRDTKMHTRNHVPLPPYKI
jgi:hypothetical protein